MSAQPLDAPQSRPWALDGETERQILQPRERTNWGPMRLTAITGRHRSTNWKVLKRHGVSRRRRVIDRSYVGRTRGLGHTVVIAVQDEHSRLV